MVNSLFIARSGLVATVRILVHIDFRVFHVVLRVVGLARARRFEVLRRHTTPDLVRTNLCVLQYQSTGSNDRPLANLAAVQQRRSHTDKGAVVDGTGVDSDIMSDSHHIAYMRRTSVVSDVDAGTVLHVSAVAYSDWCYVATHDGIEPNTALVTHRDITDDGCILTEITVLAPLGCQTTVTLD